MDLKRKFKEETMHRFNPEIIKVLVFDVDGTWFDADAEADPLIGSRMFASWFFQIQAWLRIRNGENPLEVAKSLRSLYQDLIRTKKLKSYVQEKLLPFEPEYTALVKKHGSNGKLFANEFSLDSSFLHREMMEYHDFQSILLPDPDFQATLKYLQAKGFKLGIMSTETHKTILNVASALGIDINIFRMWTGDQYPFLCSENIKLKKPSLEGFLKIMAIYCDFEPREIAYVGDNTRKDIVPPLSCHMQAIKVSTKVKEPTLNEDESYLIVHDVASLNKVF
jgi:FMN phosphatase YigB (HAD superfamily)